MLNRAPRVRVCAAMKLVSLGLATFAVAWSAGLAAAQDAEATARAEVEVDVRVRASVEVSTTEAPAPVAAAPAGSEEHLAALLHGRLEMMVPGGDYDFAALGGSVLLGADAGGGWSGGVVLGYLTEPFEDPSEVSVSLEANKDFHPGEQLGFVVAGRLGAAFMLDQRAEAGARIVGQLGAGVRIALDPRIALTLDLRGVLRVAPSGGADPLTAGMLITTGVALRLD